MLSEKTMAFITSSLNKEVNAKRAAMMLAIDGGADRETVDDNVMHYRAAKAARDEFCDWADDQEEEDGREGGMR